MRGTHWLGGLNFSAFYEYISLFCLYYFIVIIWTNGARGTVGRVVLGISMRTWVRSPGPKLCSYYFDSGIQVHCSLQRPPCTLNIWPSNASLTQINVPLLEDHHTPSFNNHIGSGKVKRAWIFWAQNLNSIPPIIANTGSLFLPFSFSLFKSFNIYFYFL